MSEFVIGDRVRLSGHWEFPDGTTGTITSPDPFLLQISEPGEWQGHCKFERQRTGVVICLYVIFDELADDGSGDGPYKAAVIEAECLHPIAPF